MTDHVLTVKQVRQILAPYVAVMETFAFDMQEKLAAIDAVQNQKRAKARPVNVAILRALSETFHEMTTVKDSSRKYTRRLAPFTNLMTDWDNMSRPVFAKLSFEANGFSEVEIEPGLVKKWGNKAFNLSDDAVAPVRTGLSLSLSIPPRQHAEGRWKNDGSVLNVVYDGNIQKTLIQCGRDQYSIHREFELKEDDKLEEILKSWFLRHGREYSKPSGVESNAQIVWNLHPHPEDYAYISRGQEQDGPKASWI